MQEIAKYFFGGSEAPSKRGAHLRWTPLFGVRADLLWIDDLELETARIRVGGHRRVADLDDAGTLATS